MVCLNIFIFYYNIILFRYINIIVLLDKIMVDSATSVKSFLSQKLKETKVYTNTFKLQIMLSRVFRNCVLVLIVDVILCYI